MRPIVSNGRTDPAIGIVILLTSRSSQRRSSPPTAHSGSATRGINRERQGEEQGDHSYQQADPSERPLEALYRDRVWWQMVRPLVSASMRSSCSTAKCADIVGFDTRELMRLVIQFRIMGWEQRITVRSAV